MPENWAAESRLAPKFKYRFPDSYSGGLDLDGEAKS